MSGLKFVSDYRWATNTILLNAAIDIFQPVFAIELGCGRFSTPVLAGRIPQVWSVENDLKWYCVMKKELS